MKWPWRKRYDREYGGVTVDTPILLRDIESDNVTFKTFDEIDKKCWIEHEGKHTSSVWNRYEAWSNSGWTQIQNVVKRKSDKKIFRITTAHGLVDVVEDHPLLLPDGDCIRPTQCLIGETRLLHNEFGSLTGTFMMQHNEVIFNIFTKTCSDNKIDIAELYFQKTVFMEIDSLISSSDNFFCISNERAVDPAVDPAVNPDVVNKIELIKNTSDQIYVYDITTENRSFQAGIGSVIVGDTTRYLTLAAGI